LLGYRSNCPCVKVVAGTPAMVFVVMNNGFWNISVSMRFSKNDAPPCRLKAVTALPN
jgi:hypothetical protein